MRAHLHLPTLDLSWVWGVSQVLSLLQDTGLWLLTGKGDETLSARCGDLLRERGGWGGGGDRQTDRQTDRQRQRQRQRETQTQRQRQTDRQTDRDRDRDRETQRQRQTDRQTQLEV